MRAKKQRTSRKQLERGLFILDDMFRGPMLRVSLPLPLALHHHHHHYHQRSKPALRATVGAKQWGPILLPAACTWHISWLYAGHSRCGELFGTTVMR